MYAIYSLTPAPWGDDYRLVESFNTEADAMLVLEELEKVNIDFNTYKIVCWKKGNQQQTTTGSLQ